MGTADKTLSITTLACIYYLFSSISPVP